MATQFVPDPAGLAAMLGAPPMVAAMRGIAERIEVEAVRIAPVRTGRYVNSIDSEAGVREGRAYGRVRAGAPYSVHVEYGNSRGAPKQRILGRALDALNLA